MTCSKGLSSNREMKHRTPSTTRRLGVRAGLADAQQCFESAYAMPTRRAIAKSCAPVVEGLVALRPVARGHLAQHQFLHGHLVVHCALRACACMAEQTSVRTAMAYSLARCYFKLIVAWSKRNTHVYPLMQTLHAMLSVGKPALVLTIVVTQSYLHSWLSGNSACLCAGRPGRQ